MNDQDSGSVTTLDASKPSELDAVLLSPSRPTKTIPPEALSPAERRALGMPDPEPTAGEKPDPELASEVDAIYEAQPTGHEPIDLAAVLKGDLTPPKPGLVRRDDGEHLLYRGKAHWLQGEPESGKSWFALAACAERLKAGERAVYVDWESSVHDIVGRMVLLGATNRQLLNHFRYVAPPGPTAKTLDVYEQTFRGASIVVLDACTEAMVNEGLDPERNMDVEVWLRELPRLAVEAGAALIVIDHVVKSHEGRGRFAIGAQHKLAKTEVSYSFHVVEPFAPGQVGRADIKVEKDRPGGIRAFALDRKKAAQMALDATEPLIIRWTFWPPREWTGPTRMMDELLAQARKDMKPRSKSALAALISGRKETKLEAVERLIVDGKLVESGKRGAYPLYAPVAAEDEPAG